MNEDERLALVREISFYVKHASDELSDENLKQIRETTRIGYQKKVDKSFKKIKNAFMKNLDEKIKKGE